MSRSTIAVLIPSCDGERFIGDCLASVQAQTHADLRVIVSDDASTDATVAVCRRAAERDQRIEVIAHPARRGWANNINSLLDIVTDKRLMILPQDDVLDPEYLESTGRALDADRGAVCAVTDVRGFGDRSQLIVHAGCGSSRLERLLGFIDAAPNGVAFRGLTRRAVVDRGVRLRIDATGSFHADTTYVCEMLALGSIVRVPEPRYLKRYQALSVMASAWDPLGGTEFIQAWAGHTVTMLGAVASWRLSRRGRRALLGAAVDRLIRTLRFDANDGLHDERMAALGEVVSIAGRLGGSGGWIEGRGDFAEGLHLSACGEMATARERLTSSVRRAPDLGEGHIALAVLAASAEDAATARLHIDSAIRARPANTWVRLRAAEVLRSLGGFEEATAQAEAAASSAPHLVWPHLVLSHLASDLGRQEEALASAAVAVGLDPDLPEVRARWERVAAETRAPEGA